MRNSLTTREPRVEDAPAIAAVHARSWRAAYRGLMPDAALAELSEASLEAMWACRLERQRPSALVTERGGAVVGWVSFDVARSDGEILGLYVDPTAWSTGMGRQLMTRAQDALRGARAQHVHLWVLAENRRARRFYEALGFDLVGGERRVVERYGTSLPEVKYRRGLE